jgi:hypothetical protein
VLDRERLDAVAALGLVDQVLLRQSGPPARDGGIGSDLRQPRRVFPPERAQLDVLTSKRRYAAIIGG